MEKVDFNIKELEKVPPQRGIFYFWNDKNKLFSGFAGNLNKKISYLVTNPSNDPNIAELLSQTTHFTWESDAKMLDIAQILKSDAKQLLFNAKINFYGNYVYLGLNPFKKPVYVIKEDTLDDYYFVGPFESRFFLGDIADIFNKLSRQFNCLITDLFLNSDNKIIAQLNQKTEELLDNLEFKEAELQEIELSVIRDYYGLLKFATTTKFINTGIDYNGKTFDITGGMLNDGKTLEDITYNKNELLAFDKAEFTERFIVYKETLSHDAQLIENIYNQQKINILTFWED